MGRRATRAADLASLVGKAYESALAPGPSTHCFPISPKHTAALTALWAPGIDAGETGVSRPADQLGISIDTVRSQLLNIFDKTGVSRQTALIRLLLAVHRTWRFIHLDDARQGGAAGIARERRAAGSCKGGLS